MLPRSRHILAVALAALVLVVLVSGTPAPAAAAADDPGVVTTVLRPGWNMVAWLGPEAPATDLWEQVPALRRASAWDAEHQRYQRRTRTSVSQHGLRTLEPGMGLWLELGGDVPVAWTQTVAPGGVLVSLRAGRNLVGWGGADGTETGEALARFGASLVSASHWDAESRRYDRYRPGSGAAASTLDELRRGDGLWVDLSADARWWQSGAPGVDYFFPESVPAERQTSIPDYMASVVTFFAERYAIRPPEFTVTVDLDLEFFAAARAGEILIGPRALNDSLLNVTLAHEYFHVLQRHLGGYSPYVRDPSPRWMTEGSATYAEGLYRHEQWGTTPEALRLAHLRRSLTVEEQLDDLTLSRRFYGESGPAYSLGALAVEWLSGYAAADPAETFAPMAPGWSDALPDRATHIAYYDLLPSAGDWEAAFETAFGLSPDDFYDSFRAYRDALTTSRYPHLGDDEDAPLLVVVGGVAAETETAVRAAFEGVQAFFAKRFGSGPADYTVYVAAGPDPVAEAHLRAFGVAPDENFCSSGSSGIAAVVVVDLGCRSEAPHRLDRHHYEYVRSRLAPWSSLPPTEDGLNRRGPWWLRVAIWSYAEHAYEATSGGATLEEFESQEAARATGVTPALASLELADDASAAGYREAWALASRAGVRLAEHAGEAALFAYPRPLPRTASWESSVAAAFGMSAADFHEAFEAYRAEAAPPESGSSASAARP
ncbi:MAG: hypothetical protein F4150_00835 [Chloroflexi bacterium]|nr:hypothetical protein [Chloroflexota bacterium]